MHPSGRRPLASVLVGVNELVKNEIIYFREGDG